MRPFLLLPLAFALSPPVCASEPPVDPASERPNLVVLHTDEHNFRTLGCYRALLPGECAFVWGDAHADQPALRADLDWAAGDATVYVAPDRAASRGGKRKAKAGREES